MKAHRCEACHAPREKEHRLCAECFLRLFRRSLHRGRHLNLKAHRELRLRKIRRSA